MRKKMWYVLIIFLHFEDDFRTIITFFWVSHSKEHAWQTKKRGKQRTTVVTWNNYDYQDVTASI